LLVDGVDLRTVVDAQDSDVDLVDGPARVVVHLAAEVVALFVGTETLPRMAVTARLRPYRRSIRRTSPRLIARVPRPSR